MQFTWHLLVIIVAILFGACLYQRSYISSGMTPDKIKMAEMYRSYAYLLFALAIIVGIYYYFIQPHAQRATMCGAMYGNQKANMCGASHY